MIYTCYQKILCTDRSSRIIILFILFSLFVLSWFFSWYLFCSSLRAHSPLSLCALAANWSVSNEYEYEYEYERLRLIAFKYYFKEKLCSPPLVCKYLGKLLNLILTMFTNKVSEGRWLTIFTIKFNFVLTIDNLIYIFENQITNIEHHLLNIGYQISSIKYWTSLRKYKKVSNGKLDIQYWIFTSEAFTSRG